MVAVRGWVGFQPVTGNYRACISGIFAVIFPCEVLRASRVACNLRVIFSTIRHFNGAWRGGAGRSGTSATVHPEPVRPVSSQRINHK